MNCLLSESVTRWPARRRPLLTTIIITLFFSPREAGRRPLAATDKRTTFGVTCRSHANTPSSVPELLETYRQTDASLSLQLVDEAERKEK